MINLYIIYKLYVAYNTQYVRWNIRIIYFACKQDSNWIFFFLTFDTLKVEYFGGVSYVIK